MMQITVIAVALSCLGAAKESGDQVEITPQETDEVLANPGMGWQTFHHFADEDKNLEGLPSSSAYFRFYWRDVEPVEGEIDFARFDELLAHARRAGQKLAFRIMCAGTSRDSIYVPQWLRDKGCPGFEYVRRGANRKYWVPDMDDRMFLDPHLQLIQALGSRYDGHPDLDLVDIGSVGLWGEWHMSGTGVDVPSMETRYAIIDAYLKAFPNTPKVMLIGDEEGMKHATRNACGWRADCLGDMGGFSGTWNHMEYFYRQQIERCGAEEAWKTAPVAFESCWDMRKWKEEGWDIRFIFDYALELHTSYLNNKSAPIPEGTRSEIERFLRKLGYRLVLRRLAHDKDISAGGTLEVSMLWENVGVAPPYRDDLLLAFRVSNKSSGKSSVSVSDTSIRGWLPGEMEITESITMPENLSTGQYELAVGIVERSTGEPLVRLAIAGRAEDGWYPISQFELVEKKR